MNRFRKLVAVVLAFALVAALSAGALAQESGGQVDPVPWSSTVNYDLYTVLQDQTERSTGKPETESHTMEIRAKIAKLTIENDGVTELEVAINGKRLKLGGLDGRAEFDISSLIQYGANSLTVESRGKPGAVATFKVEAPAFTVRLLHTNDIHAAIDPLPKIAAYVKTAKATGGEVLFVNAGDNFSGGPVSDLNQGRPMIELLNAMGTDVFAVGNHEFDHGPAATQARREESSFAWLSANAVVVDPALTPLKPFAGYRIHENRLGQRIAFIGLTQTPPATATKNTVGLRFDDPVASAQRLIALLRDRVNLLVIVSHNGLDFDTFAAPNLQGADLILGGHSHTNMSVPAVVAGIPIFQVGSSAANLSDLVLRQSNTITLSPGAAGNKWAVPTREMTAIDPASQEIVTRWKELMNPVLSTRIGANARTLAGPPFKIYTDLGLGNLIADGLRDQLDAEFAVWNNGGIRAALPAGEITMNSIYQVLPFGNFMWKVERTGAQMVDLLTRSFTRVDPGTGPRNSVDLQISGAEYVAYTKADGSLDHIEMTVGGQPIDREKVYTLAISDFMATNAVYTSVPMVPIDAASEVDALGVANYIKNRLGGVVDYEAVGNRIRVTPLP